ncbi:hypothetical protein AB0B79_38075, partial [Streptomyces sp. NPDC039022]|uniref:hypothetical protein n=1 Tax=Streptomyces sp. NPDC039022 TaxID=3157091 RepID=UPI0033C205CE
FGITAALPQYSGGLGILAGDHLKAASDLRFCRSQEVWRVGVDVQVRSSQAACGRTDADSMLTFLMERQV